MIFGVKIAEVVENERFESSDSNGFQKGETRWLAAACGRGEVRGLVEGWGRVVLLALSCRAWCLAMKRHARHLFLRAVKNRLGPSGDERGTGRWMPGYQ